MFKVVVFDPEEYGKLEEAATFEFEVKRAKFVLPSIVSIDFRSKHVLKNTSLSTTYMASRVVGELSLWRLCACVALWPNQS